jgi:hypothetical protein
VNIIKGMQIPALKHTNPDQKEQISLKPRRILKPNRQETAYLLQIAMIPPQSHRTVARHATERHAAAPPAQAVLHFIHPTPCCQLLLGEKLEKEQSGGSQEEGDLNR